MKNFPVCPFAVLTVILLLVSAVGIGGCCESDRPKSTLSPKHFVPKVSGMKDGEAGWIRFDEMKASNERVLSINPDAYLFNSRDEASAYQAPGNHEGDPEHLKKKQALNGKEPKVGCVAKIEGQLRVFVCPDAASIRWFADESIGNYQYIVLYDTPLNHQQVQQMIDQGLGKDLVAKSKESASEHVAKND